MFKAKFFDHFPTTVNGIIGMRAFLWAFCQHWHLYIIVLKCIIHWLLNSSAQSFRECLYFSFKAPCVVSLPELFRVHCSWSLTARSNNFPKLNHVNKFYCFCNDHFWSCLCFITCIINYASSKTQQILNTCSWIPWLSAGNN